MKDPVVFLIVPKTQSRKIHPKDVFGVYASKLEADKVIEVLNKTGKNKPYIAEMVPARGLIAVFVAPKETSEYPLVQSSCI